MKKQTGPKPLSDNRVTNTYSHLLSVQYRFY